MNASTPGTTDFAEIRYYNKELTQTEITALYQNPFGVDSKGLTEGNMGGWTIASDAIHSGTKVADTIPAAAGAITIGSSGYIGAQKFQLTTAGNAIFSGSISIADATMGQLTQSRGFDDFFQVEGGIDGGFRLQAKATAFAGGATFQEFGSAIGTASAGTSVLCVLKGTKVITQRGEINIEDTKESDLIKVYDWFTKEWGYSPIDKILNRVTKEGWSHIKTKKGYELKCSNSHLLYHPDYPKCAIAADKLGVGGQLYIVENDKIVEDYIESIEVYDEPVEVWNYELKLTHNYISNGILSHNGLPKEPFTAPHLHIKRNDVEIETGDLVKLDDNNELVKVSDSKDTSVIGILWQKVEILQEQISLLNKMKEVAGEESVDLTNELYRDSLNNLIPENERDSKSLWAVAAIGDTRDYDSNLNGMKICNQNGEVKMGDLICSSDNSGYAMRQSDEYVVVGFDCDVDSSLDRPIYEKRQNLCSHTIGKVMQDVEFDENGNAENVYAYLYCG